MGFQVALVVKNTPVNAGDVTDIGLIPGSGRFPWRRAWQPTPVFLSGEFNGQRSLAGYSLWGCKESDTTEQLMWLVHTVVQWRPVQHCKAVILQLKTNKIFKSNFR